MKTPYDHFAKQIGQRALDASGPTVIQLEVSPETQHADVWHNPSPARKRARRKLGLLGRMASRLSLIEVFAHLLGGAELRACLTKHFAYWNAHTNKIRRLNIKRKRTGRPPVPLVEPMLWILASTVSRPLLGKIGARRARGWPRGVTFLGDDIFRVGIVSAADLPRDRSTLLARLMAAGPGLAIAIKDLAALPRNAVERTVAGDLVLWLKNRLARKRRRTKEEEELMVKMQQTWEQARIEGEARGEAKGEARALLAALRVRGIPVPEAARARILAEMDTARLERWVERAVVASSVDEVLAAPARRTRARPVSPAAAR